jgi:hypothetical protein
LLDTGGYRRKYSALLEKQMNRKDAAPEVFAEAGAYYLATAKLNQALDILKTGMEKTGSAELVALYEKNRYTYEVNRAVYDDVTAIYGATVQVQKGGQWGIAKADGTALIPCAYEKISTFSVDRAIAQKGEEIFALDSNNNRLAKLHESAGDFGNYAQDRLPVLTESGWRRCNGELTPGNMAFEALGMYSGGYAAARLNGRWGIIDSGSVWLIPPAYDELILDELGRCYAQEALFFRRGGVVYLRSGGAELPEAYEDARPFASGYAAVKKDGKWGFIDASGAVRIEFAFEDALSFGQHLAAVRQDGLWGYISVYGDMVIEPVFKAAKSFSNGSAPVLSGRGWQFITLLEYKKGAAQ